MSGRGPRVLPADDRGAVTAAVETLRQGAIVAIPTDTVYGIASALDPSALDRLLAAKRRSPTKGITVLVDSVEQAANIALFPAAATALAERFWPGPLTLVLAARRDARLPAALTGGTGAVGIRMPDHPLPRAIAACIGPLPTTSANLSGEPDALSAGDVVERLRESVELVLDGGLSAGGVPSTVAALSPQGELRILRAGALPVAWIREAVVAAFGVGRHSESATEADAPLRDPPASPPGPPASTPDSASCDPDAAWARDPWTTGR